MKTKMTYESIVSKMVKICQKQKVKLVLNDADVQKDNGYSFEDSEIHLSHDYSSNFIMLAIFTHELGHIRITRRKAKKYRKMSIFEEETLAWALAMEYQMRYFNRKFTKTQGKFMLECLSTYSTQHYNFRKSYNQTEKDGKELHIS